MQSGSVVATDCDKSLGWVAELLRVTRIRQSQLFFVRCSVSV
jgi:hypothetical protein